jgi:hypothetical protein
LRAGYDANVVFLLEDLRLTQDFRKDGR